MRSALESSKTTIQPVAPLVNDSAPCTPLGRLSAVGSAKVENSVEPKLDFFHHSPFSIHYSSLRCCPEMGRNGRIASNTSSAEIAARHSARPRTWQSFRPSSRQRQPVARYLCRRPSGGSHSFNPGTCGKR